MPALFLTEQIGQWGDLLFTAMELLNLAAAYSGKKPQDKTLPFLDWATHSPLQREHHYRDSGTALTLKLIQITCRITHTNNIFI